MKPRVTTVEVSTPADAPPAAAVVTPATAPPLQAVAVASSEPPEPAHQRAQDRRWSETSRGQIATAFRWVFAVVVEHWRGLSETRLLAIGVYFATVALGGEWIYLSKGAGLGWAFTAFVLGGFFLAAVLAFGAKYFDKLLTIVAAKAGVALTNAPIPGTPAGGLPHAA